VLTVEEDEKCFVLSHEDAQVLTQVGIISSSCITKQMCHVSSWPRNFLFLMSPLEVMHTVIVFNVLLLRVTVRAMAVWDTTTQWATGVIHLRVIHRKAILPCLQLVICHHMDKATVVTATTGNYYITNY